MRTILDIYHNGKMPTFETEEESGDFLYHLGRLVYHALHRAKEDSVNYATVHAADLEDVVAVFNRPIPREGSEEVLIPMRDALTTPGSSFVLGVVRHRDGKYGIHS